ncbi:MAG TPA: FAD-dependent oxidoreductase, partial [Burkholderiaceae bacterium]|nr:FAD-dependent oxidoreductase [Burkholderiaceae bacterium]
SRMVLPYYLEQGISEAHTETVSANQLEAWEVTTHFGRRAVSLDTKKNVVKLDNDDEVPYDNLLIATGSSAARLPLPGCDGEGVYSFWTLADAKGLNAHVSPDSHVVMVGAGFIAFTILNGIIQRAGKVTIVEVADRIRPRMIDDTGAKLVGDWLEQRGVTLRTGVKLKGIADQGGKKKLSFEDGSDLQADVVVMATGIRTNLDWLEGSGVTVNQGIVVDDQLRSNVSNVFAAGDVAEGKNRITGAAEVHAIEPTAMEHGRVAGANMAGKKIAYPGSLMMNIVGVAGLDIASFGTWEDSKAEVIEGLHPERSSYRKYLFHGDKLTGAIYVGPDAETWSGNDLGMLKGLVQSGQSLGPWKAYLKDHPFDIKKPYLAQQTVSALMPSTVLGQPTPSPRG